MVFRQLDDIMHSGRGRESVTQNAISQNFVLIFETTRSQSTQSVVLLLFI